MGTAQPARGCRGALWQPVWGQPPAVGSSRGCGRTLRHRTELCCPSPAGNQEPEHDISFPPRLLPAQGLPGGPGGPNLSRPLFGAGSPALSPAASPASPSSPLSGNKSTQSRDSAQPSGDTNVLAQRRFPRVRVRSWRQRRPPTPLPADALSQGSAGKDKDGQGKSCPTPREGLNPTGLWLDTMHRVTCHEPRPQPTLIPPGSFTARTR